MQTAVVPVFLFVGCLIALAVILLILPRIVGVGRRERVKEMPYESGMDPIHDTRRRFTVRFHLVAIAFLVFDVELLFLYPWAVAMRPAPVTQLAAAQAESGTTALAAAAPRGIDAAVAQGLIPGRSIVFAGAMLFIVLLVLGFAYDWQKGVFHWQ